MNREHKEDENIEMLPKFSLPFLPKDKSYRTFQISGDSMLPIPEGAWLRASFIQNWELIKERTPCVVVTLE
jgi:hypothetical protein